ncbi:MAG: indole-3-glycerol phosphate synthase TrpC [Alphaproteobacteria bacterium]|nr:indole-3-glycerol phosphate synthase TrpC [Alphaproteobacteria bacterium]
MTNKLQQICADKRLHVATLKAGRSFSSIDEEARNSPLLQRGFERALTEKAEAGRVGLIAEIKKASPSAGLIRPDFNPAALAQAYETGGVTCLSVLTDEPYFQGGNAFLEEARAACSLPVLRKDFMIDTWQIAESRVLGADCVLLIMAALDDVLAGELYEAAIHYGLDVLIEVHDFAEMARALDLMPTGLIGINNRNLKTLTIDLKTTEELVAFVPRERTVVSESGLTGTDDMRRLRACGVNCFLMGESLMRQQDVAQAVRDLLA